MKNNESIRKIFKKELDQFWKYHWLAADIKSCEWFGIRKRKIFISSIELLIIVRTISIYLEDRD